MFFFYGLLQPGFSNAASRLVARKLTPIGAAMTKGTLFAIEGPSGAYPALIPGATGTVHGSLYAKGPQWEDSDLARLDKFENVVPSRPGQSEYRRAVIDLIGPDGDALTATAYIYPERPKGARRILTGDFAYWLKVSSKRAWRD